MGEDPQAPEAPKSDSDALEEALAKFIEFDTRAEHERHTAAVALLDEQQRDLSAKVQVEYARHAAAIASLRERAVAKLLAAAESIPAPAPAAPKAERNKRTNKQIEADGNAIVAKLSPSFGLSPSAIAQAAGLDAAVVRATLRGLVESGRVTKRGEGKGACYYLPEPQSSPAVNGGA